MKKIIDFISKLILPQEQSQPISSFERFIGNKDIQRQLECMDEVMEASRRSEQQRKILKAQKYKEKFRAKYGNEVDKESFWTRPDVMAAAASFARSDSSCSSSNSSSGSDGD